MPHEGKVSIILEIHSFTERRLRFDLKDQNGIKSFYEKYTV